MDKKDIEKLDYLINELKKVGVTLYDNFDNLKRGGVATEVIGAVLGIEYALKEVRANYE